MTIYNDNARHAPPQLRALMDAGYIGKGVIDRRSIKELTGDDLRPYKRVHLFAGCGGWDYALKLAGWPDDRPVWTGSCPCQPFSAAGKRKGKADDRHLWPEMFRLVRECRPDIVFGEQVASAIGHGWLDGVCLDLEGEDYAVGAIVLGAHSVRSPQKRQRLYWVAIRLCSVSDSASWIAGDRAEQCGREFGFQPILCSNVCSVSDADARIVTQGIAGQQSGIGSGCAFNACPVSDATNRGRPVCGRANISPGSGHIDGRGPWDDYEIIWCRDPRGDEYPLIPRRIKPGLAPLVDGLPGRVAALSAIGKRAVRHAIFDANYWKTFVHARLAVPMGDPGCVSLFGHKPEQHRLFADHLCSEYRVKTQGRGRTVDEWKLRVDGLDNHWLDCAVGAAVAASMQGVILFGTDSQPVPREKIKLSALKRRER